MFKFLFCIFFRIWVPIVIAVFVLLIILVAIFIWKCTPLCSNKEDYEVTPKIAPVTLTQQKHREEDVAEV